MIDDFWTGKLDFTSSIHFDGYGDGMASGQPDIVLNAGRGRGFADGKTEID